MADDPDPIGIGPIGPGPIGPEPPSTPAAAAPDGGVFIRWPDRVLTRSLAVVASAGLVLCPQPPDQGNNVTIEKWQQPLSVAVQHGWPQRPYSPFVPREAVLDNTVTPDTWMRGFTPPVPRSPVRHTTPFYGFPYFSADNNQPTGWWQPLTRAAPRPPVWSTQPFFGYPYISVDNNVTIEKWQQPLSTAPVAHGWPLAKPYAPFVPKEATLENTPAGSGGWQQQWPRAVKARPPVKTYPQFVPGGVVERVGVEWMPRWYGPTRQRRPLNTQPVFTPQVAFVDNTVTPDKWMMRWQIAPKRFPRITQPTYTTVNFPFVAVQYSQTVDATLVTSVEVHFCGWGTTPQVADASVEQGEQSTTWTDADEQVTDYDEQDPECGS